MAIKDFNSAIKINKTKSLVYYYRGLSYIENG